MANDSRLRDYVAWVASPDGAVTPVADARLLTDSRGRHLESGLRYRSEWLRRPDALALNPVHAPLQSDPMEWETRETPAFLDDVLPGRWEQAVRARIRDESFDPGDLHAMLARPGRVWHVGHVVVLPLDVDPPPLSSAVRFEHLASLAGEAERIHQHRSPELEALKRLQAGSSVGGARPKVLVDDEGAWLVKFNLSDDAFNHARVEHACLLLAEHAGIPVPASRPVSAGNVEALAIRRFDVMEPGGRRGLISANALLKARDTQADPVHAGYDDLVELVRGYSTRPTADLRQLYAQMLFNEAINNRDDHLKNFSFLHDPEAFHLSPAYDLVPSEAHGAYPQLDLGSSPHLPSPDTEEAIKAGKTFQLAPAEARAVNDRLADALDNVETIRERAGLSGRDWRFLRDRLPRRFRPTKKPPR